MSRLMSHSIAAFAVVILLSLAVSVLAGTPGQKKDDEKIEDDTSIALSPFCVSSGGMGATVGGAKNITFFRSGALNGRIPDPASLTPEGLFSGYDLPLDTAGDRSGLFHVQAAAVPARFEVLPGVRYLAQLGLGSGLRAATWKRAPLNLIAVVDKSGSMDGEPLALVRASLHRALQHLRDGDQFGIVLYGDRSHVHLDPTPVNAFNRDEISGAIDAIASAGSTNMEAGLSLGYDVARRSGADFSGTTRLMLFTDERPNVGETAAGSFMALAEAGAADRIGLTTIGVGEQFDPELAQRIGSVRGGNLYFFSSGEEMTKTFADDFDTMVSELARDFVVRITPQAGLQIEGIFGVPGDLLRWEGRTLVLDVATVFLSHRQGAIYFALSPTDGRSYLPSRDFADGAAVAHVAFSYRDASDDRKVHGRLECCLLASAAGQLGLERGRHLVDEYLTLKRAAQLHTCEHDDAAAFRLAGGLLSRLQATTDTTLAPERTLVAGVYNTLAFLSGHVGEVRLGADHPVNCPLVGVWRRNDGSRPSGSDEYLLVWPHGVIEHVSLDRRTQAMTGQRTFALTAEVPAGPAGTLPLAAADHNEFPRSAFMVDGDRLTLTGPGDDRSSGPPAHYRRWSYPDLPVDACNETDRQPAAIDSLCGLPARQR